MPDTNKKPLTSMRQDGLYFSPADLENKAREVAKNQPEEIKELVYLYYLARHYVSFYEVVFGEMPDQILNEYRNSLDHMMRCLSKRTDGNLAGDDNDGNLRKAIAHMQRAVLDACKYIVIGSQERLKEFKKTYSAKVLILVTDGKFYKTFIEKEKEATELYKAAKIFDSVLGEKETKNTESLKKYIDSADSFYESLKMIEDNSIKIAEAVQQYDNIHKGGQVLSVRQQTCIGVIIGVIIAATFFWLGSFL